MAELEASRIPYSREHGTEVDIALERGDVLQVSGASGVGKTTLLRMLARLTSAGEGRLSLRGIDARQTLPAEWRRQVAYLPQRPVMLPGAVRDNLAAGFLPRQEKRRFDRQAALDLMERVALDRSLLDRDGRVLSGGEAARVALCRAMLLDPVVLLADEITAGLDTKSAAAVVDSLARWIEDGGILLLIAHDDGCWQNLGHEIEILRLGA